MRGYCRFESFHGCHVCLPPLGILFLGSMLPQYLAMFVSFVLFVCVSKKFSLHAA